MTTPMRSHRDIAERIAAGNSNLTLAERARLARAIERSLKKAVAEALRAATSGKGE